MKLPACHETPAAMARALTWAVRARPAAVLITPHQRCDLNSFKIYQDAEPPSGGGIEPG
jgi:hypothetical protein